MYRDKRICVVVPCYKEETQIERTLTTMPTFVDDIVAVDDASPDKTAETIATVAAKDKRVHLLRRTKNGGVGAAISDGYVWCRENNIDIAVVMAGDGQMDPADLPALLNPVVDGKVNYAKGNRLITGEAWKKIPHVRYLGNSALTFLTKIASGYWHVTDSQTGYTALDRKALHLLPLEDIYPRYGMPNDFLVTCNIYNLRVCDVPINPVYGVGEKSGIRISRVVFSLSFLLARLFLRRMVQKYIIRDFHPLVFFYGFGALLLTLCVPLSARLFYFWAVTANIPKINALAIMFCAFMGFQSLLFAMLFDMEANRDLKDLSNR